MTRETLLTAAVLLLSTLVLSLSLALERGTEGAIQCVPEVRLVDGGRP